MAGDANDAELPKISRSITFSREAILGEMWKRISSPCVMSAIEKSISVPRILHGLISSTKVPRGEIYPPEISYDDGRRWAFHRSDRKSDFPSLEFRRNCVGDRDWDACAHTCKCTKIVQN